MTSQYYVKADLGAAKAAQAAMGKKSAFWKPDPGIHMVRILPPHPNMQPGPDGKTSFFQPFALHWGIGPTPVPCPRRMGLYGGVCPVCAHAQKLQNAGKEKEAGELWPRWASYMNIILMDADGDPIVNEKGEIEVHVWSPGKDTLAKIFNAIERESPAEDKLLDITDPAEGWTLRCKRTGKDAQDTEWDISCAKGGQVSIAEYVEFWGPKLNDLSTYTPVLPPDALSELLRGGTAQQAAPVGAIRRALPAGDAEDEEAPRRPRAEIVAADDDDYVAPAPVKNGKSKLEELVAKQRAAAGAK